MPLDSVLAQCSARSRQAEQRDEQRIAVLELPGVAIVGTRGRGDGETGDGSAVSRGPQFGICREVAHHGDDGFACHDLPSYLWFSESRTIRNSYGLLGVFTKNLRADDGFVQVEHTIELGADLGSGRVVDHHVVAFGLAVNLVSELATSPNIGVLDGTTFLW